MTLQGLGETELAELVAQRKNSPAPSLEDGLFAQARRVRQAAYGKKVFLRGLVEFTSHCRMDCYYCGLRRSNATARRFRLADEEVLACCALGYQLGFRTFVLQGGEDPVLTDGRLCRLVDSIKTNWPQCSLTLSVGERSKESYRALRRAGADRYLLRHETADPAHYALLHPPGQSLASRKRCLWDLKELGFQVGAGFMVGSPFQTDAHLAADLAFLRELQPEMVGIGPFIPHGDTPFAAQAAGALWDTLHMLALVRLLLPSVLLPATTALGTIHPQGREMGLQAGANVVMPNLSPPKARQAYSLYNGKLATGAEAAEGLAELHRRVEAAGYHIDMGRGDHAD